MPETSSRPAGIEAFLAERGRLVEGALDRYLPPADAPPELIHQAMRHSVFAGGKRLRPALVFLGERGRLVEGALDRYLPPADAPPELIHQAMRHSVFAGGKRLRPALVFLG